MLNQHCHRVVLETLIFQLIRENATDRTRKK